MKNNPTIQDTPCPLPDARHLVTTRQSSTLQPQHAIASPGKRQIMSDENRGELMGSVQIGQELEDHLSGPEIQISGWFVGQQNRRVCRPGRAPVRLFAVRPRTVPPRGARRVLQDQPPPTSLADAEAASACDLPRISNGIITFSSAVNSGSR